MGLDPELLKQLIVTFKSELEEQSQVLTDCLLSLEKEKADSEEFSKKIEIIFRAAHNIKGAARGIGIADVSEIAHHLEEFFSSIQKKTKSLSPKLIDLCLEAIDKMNVALDAYIEKKKIPFDLNTFLAELAEGENKKINKEVSKKLKQDSSHHETIRISIDKIDKISALMEEMQVNKIAINENHFDITQLHVLTKQFAQLWKQASLSNKASISKLTHENFQRLFIKMNDCFTEMNKLTTHVQKNMQGRINELSILSNSLQEEIRLLRLIPAGHLLCTLPRYLRDLSNELHKDVELSLIGEEVRLDKLVLEGLKDPLIHLLRNAVDHGIESPEERNKIGKSPTGKITIAFKENGNKISIVISDDGRGVDAKAIKEIALKRKLFAESDIEKLSDKEAIQLIFNSGFSTRETITTISGRGVGLDVVKSNIQDLKGEVTLDTHFGKGSTFHLEVPLTLASERGLLFKCNDQLFVLPTVSVQRVLMIKENQIIQVEGGHAIFLNDLTIPLHELSDILNLNKNEYQMSDNLSVIVVEKEMQRIAFIVDEIIGEREIVIKPFHAPLGKIPCVSGGTLLESNQVVIVLNPYELIDTVIHSNRSNSIRFNIQQKEAHEKIQILVVDDSITTRTLEKNILESKNYQVTVAVNGKEAWDLLQKQKFSLLITDVSMPVMDGFTLTEQVKKSERLHDLPVIIVTSLDSEAEKKRGMEVGANAYVVKNEFESGALLNMVSQLI